METINYTNARAHLAPANAERLIKSISSLRAEKTKTRQLIEYRVHS
jgi:hypothetical protein